MLNLEQNIQMKRNFQYVELKFNKKLKLNEKQRVAAAEKTHPAAQGCQPER